MPPGKMAGPEATGSALPRLTVTLTPMMSLSERAGIVRRGRMRLGQ